jgi:hypothetical protein
MIITTLGSQEAFSQQIDWNLGNGLKQGDYFRYSMCHVDYNDCTIFETEFWINGIKQVGSETRWVAQTTVHDGNKIIKGEMELGKISPEPLGGSPELKVYRDAFKSSIAWISGFSKGYGDMKWGIGSRIEIHSDKTETVYTRAGVFDSRVIYWNDNNQTSKIWVVDEIPFPVKADTWIPFSEGDSTNEFRFDLLEYNQNITENPFSKYDDMNPASNLTPAIQIKNGIKPENILCKEDFKLIFKIDNSPACVKPESISKLIERGWAKPTNPIKNNQITKQQTWVSKQPISCIHDLCYLEDLENYYEHVDLLVEPNLGSLKGLNFEYTSEILKDEFAKHGIRVFDIRYEQEKISLCEAWECWDEYSLHVLISNFTTQQIIDLGFFPDSPNV